MKIVYHKSPVYHVIIYDFFSSEEYTQLQKEIDYLLSTDETILDEHHKKISFCNIKTWQLDSIYNTKRSESKLLTSTARAFEVPLDRTQFPFADLLPLTNLDTSYLHAYKNNSYYMKHRDNSYMTFLFNFWKKDTFNGGELEFTDYSYRPHLTANSLLIFPGNVMHHVNLLSQDDETLDRVILNRRCWIEMK